jgi:hypothetical protein
MQSPEYILPEADRVRHLEALLADIKAAYEVHLRDRETLDKKAWDILSFMSGLIGLVTTIQIGLLGTQVRELYWLTLVTVLIMYALLVLEIRKVVRPRLWMYPPGPSRGEKLSFNNIMRRYIDKTPYEYYLVKLIADYVGDNASPPNAGAIQIAENLNAEKAKHLQNAFRLMSMIIFGLVLGSVTTFFY